MREAERQIDGVGSTDKEALHCGSRETGKDLCTIKKVRCMQTGMLMVISVTGFYKYPNDSEADRILIKIKE